MVTYGDLMSLLMTFFVLLLSFSTITEEELFREAIMSFRGAVGLMPRELTVVQVSPLPAKYQRPSRSAEELARKLRRQLQVLGKEGEVKVEFDGKNGLKLTLPSQILFGSAEASVKADAYPILNDLAAIFAEFPEAIFEVRGHTDDRPLASHPAFRDNYDLSYGRADSVARYLQREGRIPLEKFEIIARGAGDPVAPNTTEEGRAANRRVEIHVRGLLADDAYEEISQEVDSLTSDEAPNPATRN